MARLNPLRHLDARERTYGLCALTGYAGVLVTHVAFSIYEGGPYVLSGVVLSSIFVTAFYGTAFALIFVTAFYGTAFALSFALIVFGDRYGRQRATSAAARWARLVVGIAVVYAGVRLGTLIVAHAVWSLDHPDQRDVYDDAQRYVFPDAHEVELGEVYSANHGCDASDPAFQDETSQMQVVRGIIGPDTVGATVFYRRRGYRDWYFKCWHREGTPQQAPPAR